MRKIASLFVALLLLAGCSSVPLTGRKQVPVSYTHLTLPTTERV